MPPLAFFLPRRRCSPAAGPVTSCRRRPPVAGPGPAAADPPPPAAAALPPSTRCPAAADALPLPADDSPAHMATHRAIYQAAPACTGIPSRITPGIYPPTPRHTPAHAQAHTRPCPGIHPPMPRRTPAYAQAHTRPCPGTCPPTPGRMPAREGTVPRAKLLRVPKPQNIPRYKNF